jgi:hypothetical protein
VQQLREGEAQARLRRRLLQDPKLLDRLLTDFAACGVVGEENNKLVAYLATVSRKLDQPLAVIMQSTSAAGKTALMEAALAFVPPEDRVKYSALTGQALYYLGDADLKHKILAIVEEEGAERASSCHMFRHTCATLMLENGADIRFIQQLLGHAELSTTQIYTQVSIRALKEVHTRTHPARLSPEVDAELAEELADELAEDET